MDFCLGHLLCKTDPLVDLVVELDFGLPEEGDLCQADSIRAASGGGRLVSASRRTGVLVEWCFFFFLGGGEGMDVNIYFLFFLHGCHPYWHYK